MHWLALVALKQWRGREGGREGGREVSKIGYTIKKLSNIKRNAERKKYF